MWFRVRSKKGGTWHPGSSGALWALILGMGILAPGCATLRQVAALRQVEFRIDRVGEVRLAGVDLTAVRSYEDLEAMDAARITAAALQKRLPLQFALHLRATNPQDNAVSARLVRMEWTLLLQDKETIRGVIDRALLLPPGEPRDIPVDMSLDLYDFFASSSRDLVDLVLAAAGHDGARASIALRAVPSVETAFGPLRYPEPITIVRREIGTPSRL